MAIKAFESVTLGGFYPFIIFRCIVYYQEKSTFQSIHQYLLFPPLVLAKQ